MADQTDFKHITVNPGDADDVVIQAGIVDAGAGADPLDRGSTRCEPADDVRPDPATAATLPTAAAAAHDGEPRSAASEPTPSSSSAYHETTLEDIKSSKMPKTQIIVIALALVAIAAFVIWNVATA